MKDFDFIKLYYKMHSLPETTKINQVGSKITVAYLELSQLADWHYRYDHEPEGKSDEWMQNYNYNKECDSRRTDFDEKKLKGQLLLGLTELTWEVLAWAFIMNPNEVSFDTLNKKLKDSNNSRKHNPFVFNASMAYGALKQYFTHDNQFIPKVLNKTMLDQLFQVILDLCHQFELDFIKGWEYFCEGKEHEENSCD